MKKHVLLASASVIAMVMATAAYAGDPLISRIIDFINTAKRPLTMAVHRAELGADA